jgi:hypothetical protein
MLNSSSFYPLTVELAQQQAASAAGGGPQPCSPPSSQAHWLASVPLIIAFLVLERYWQARLTTGGVKELGERQHMSSDPTTIHIRVSSRSELDEQLQRANETLQAIALRTRTDGILITKHQNGIYTVSLSNQVPYGLTRERYAQPVGDEGFEAVLGGPALHPLQAGNLEF